MDCRVTSVSEEPAGSELDAAISAGATVIPVVDSDDFEVEGGQLLLDDGTNAEILPYAYDEDADEITVTPTENAYAAETPVSVPGAVERWASVLEPDSEEELEARVPHALYDRLPLGVRQDDGEAEIVEVDYLDDELVVADVLFREPVVDGSYIVGGTQPRQPDGVLLLDDFNRADGDPGLRWLDVSGWGRGEILDEGLTADSGQTSQAWGVQGQRFVSITLRELGDAGQPMTYLELLDGRVGVGVYFDTGSDYGSKPGVGMIDFYVEISAGVYWAEQIEVENFAAGQQVGISWNQSDGTAAVWKKRVGESWGELASHTDDYLLGATYVDQARVWTYPGNVLDDFRGDQPTPVTDSLPPASSPTPTLRQGVGAIVVSFTPIANNDLVTYEIYLGTSTPLTAAPASLVDGDAAGLTFIRHEADGDPLDYDTDYYVRVIARDADGAAGASPTQGPIRPGRVDTPDVVPNSITAELLESVMTISTLFKTAAAGRRVEWDTDGIRLYASDGTTILANLPTDGTDPVISAVIHALGLDLQAGTGTANKVEWNDSGSLVAELYAYVASSTRNLLLSAHGSSSLKALAELQAFAQTGEHAEVEVYAEPGAGLRNVQILVDALSYILLDKNDKSNWARLSALGTGKVAVKDGATVTLRDSSDQAEFPQLYSGGSKATAQRRINHGTFSIVVGANPSATTTVAHGLGVAPAGAIAVCDKTLNAGSARWIATVDLQGGSTTNIGIGVRSNNDSNAGGTISGYWMAWA